MKTSQTLRVSSILLVCASVVTVTQASPASQVEQFAAAKGREYVYQMDPIPEGLISARFHLWIPDSVSRTGRIRGVIAQNGYNYGLMPEVFRAAHWRALASELGLALCLYRVQESNRKHAGGPGSAPVTVAAIEGGLEHFAQTLGRPELKHSGLIFTGLSASGRQAIYLGNEMAARTIAVIVYSPATNLPHPLDTGVPVLINMGGRDLKHGNPIGLDKLILAARTQGAPWLGLFQARVPHNGHGDPSFVMDWARWAVKARVPETIPADVPVQLKSLAIEKGWLGRLRLNSDLNDPHPEGPDAATVRPCFGGADAAKTAYWLPTEALARDWKEYCLRPDVRFVNGMGEEPVLRNESFVNSIGMRLVMIPAGQFIMGSPADEEKRAEDETQHPVRITNPFYMAATEVTQAQWLKVMTNNPSGFLADVNPVENVSYDDALAFCKALSRLEGRPYRLPTEAEWEYACRAGTATPFHFGWSIDTDLANYRGDVGYGGGTSGIDRRRPGPVAQFAANAWGLHDMHGNVFEWCADGYGPYPTGAFPDPKGPQDGTQRVFRGGAWYTLPHLTRAAFRGMSAPGYKSLMVGFRVVAEKRG